MASKYSDSPAYRINKWITSELRSNDVIPEATDYVSDVEGNIGLTLPFMMVAQQTPESSTPYTDADKYKDLPFCVYSIEQTGGHGQPWTNHGRVTYIFYAGSASKIIEISNLVHDLTHREDWSAQDLNFFLTEDATNPFEFNYICFLTGVGPRPQPDEGGRYGYMCVIEWDAIYQETDRPAYDMNPGPDGNSQIGIGRI